MSKNKNITSYVSPIDQFINRFDQENPQLSVSQLQEIAKFRRIYYLRDVAERPEVTIVPEDF